jgi:hypothetical protein
MLGLKEDTKAKVAEKKDDKKPAASQNEEAKAVLAKMQAKKDAGDCPFC